MSAMTQRWTRNRQGEVSPVPQPPTFMMTYPIMLRDGVMAQAILPVDLTDREAKRFCAMVQTVAFTDEELAIGRRLP